MSEYAWNIQTSRCLIIETSNRCPPPPPLPPLCILFANSSVASSNSSHRRNRLEKWRVDIRPRCRTVVEYNIFFVQDSSTREKGGKVEEEEGERGVVARASRDVEGKDGVTPRRVEICIFEGEKGERRGALPWRKKKGKENESSDILRFRGVGIEATKGLPLPNDLSVFVSRLTHRREILVKPSCCSFPSLSLALARFAPFFFFSPPPFLRFSFGWWLVAVGYMRAVFTACTVPTGIKPTP